MRVLVACERSQRVCKEFRLLGHEAFSCDVQEGEIEPLWHFHCDCADVLNLKWDMIIAFPPCKYLSVAGAQYWNERREEQEDAIRFVRKIYDCSCPKIAIENPVGVLSTKWRKPDQIIHPYMFGEPYTKRTCLWLKGLPPLEKTKVVTPTGYWCSSSYRGGLKKDGTRNKNPLKNLHPFGKTKDRDVTFQGIAFAMANQWSRMK